MEISALQVLDYLNFKGQKVLDEEAQNKLRHIVRCAICFEIPKQTHLKVLTCEQGHHFCLTCCRKLNRCGVCRGRFLSGRNFVVEDLISQLGPSLGLTETKLTPPDATSSLMRGKYPCLHGCPILLKAGQMINHIRKYHKENFLDNVRSNPFLKRFDWMVNVTYSVGYKNIFSVQISDMGLFTLIINFTNDCLIGTLHSLSHATVSNFYQYKLCMKINKTGYSQEFSVSNCDFLSYNYDIQNILSSEKYLKLETSKLSELISTGNQFQIISSIWRRVEEENVNSGFKIFIPENPVVFDNDRKKRRNMQRNLRKRRLKHKLRDLKNLEQVQNQIQNIKVDGS